MVIPVNYPVLKELGGMVLPVPDESNRLTWASVPVCFDL